MLGNFSNFLSADIFQNIFSEKFFQEYNQSDKLFVSRSGMTLCLASSGSELFAKNISKRQKFPLAGKETHG